MLIIAHFNVSEILRTLDSVKCRFLESISFTLQCYKHVNKLYIYSTLCYTRTSTLYVLKDLHGNPSKMLCDVRRLSLLWKIMYFLL